MIVRFSSSDLVRILLQADDSGGGGSPDDGNKGADQPGRKLIPESDLLAVKNRYEKDLTDIRGSLTNLQSKYDQAFQESNQLKASKSDLENQLSEARASSQEAETLRQRIAALEESKSSLEKTVLQTKRMSLAERHGFKDEDLKDYTPDQLSLLENALSKIPNRRGSIDRGGGGSSNAPTSARDRIRLGLEQRSKS